MMKSGEIDGYMLKPMNAPSRENLRQSGPFVPQPPLRLAEFGTVYRWEQSGEISGMTRVRGFTQDDAHLFVTEDQLADEVLGCIELVQIIFDKLGMEDTGLQQDPDCPGTLATPSAGTSRRRRRAAAESLGALVGGRGRGGLLRAENRLRRPRASSGREWQLGNVHGLQPPGTL